MASIGTVRTWSDEEGWGVIDSDETPGGCWAHYSHLLVTGYRTLRGGQLVEFRVEVAAQDGYAYRATGMWPAGETPVRTEPSDPSSAYRSSLTISFDEADGDS